MIRHLDLFSGIGGNTLAAEIVWRDQHETVSFCDFAPFPQAVLRARWPGVPVHGDIKTLNGGGFGRIDLLTGGFPCQPFSAAGKRRGKEDDRDLWPEMFRVIREAKPRWILGENVAGFINMELERTALDLESEGYEVVPFVIPAVAVGAPHKRDRVWIVAYSGHIGSEKSEIKTVGSKELASSSDSSDSSSLRNRRGTSEERRTQERKLVESEPKGSPLRSESERRAGFHNATDTKSRKSGKSSEQERGEDFERRSWETHWLDVATRLCRVDDGIPARMDGLELSKAKHRNERIKALGNSIVPQVAVEIMRAMKEVDATFV